MAEVEGDTQRMIAQPIDHDSGVDVIDCQSALARLGEYLDSEMSIGDLHRWKDHLDDCNDCWHELDVQRSIKRMVREACGDQAPEYLRQRVAERLAAAKAAADL